MTKNDWSTLRLFGHTSSVTAVPINKVVTAADLRILTGMIKLHCQVEYFSGGKLNLKN
jgi:nickel-dependent lactate racemase